MGSPWQRGTLAAVRSLAATGHRPHVAASVPGHAGRSRHCARYWTVPPCEEPGFGAAIQGVVRRAGVDAVVATDDEHLAVLTARPDLVAPAVLAHPEVGTVARACDKRLLRDAATRVGIAVPEDTEILPRRDPSQWIVKRRRYCPGDVHEHLRVDELLVRGLRLDDDWIYQRVIEGPMVAVVVLADRDGTLLYAAAQRALRVHPAPFGVSTRARAVDLPGWWRDHVAGLVVELGWWGLAELQFICPPGRPPHLIDFNGRPFGSMAFTSAHGVDLVGAQVDLALAATTAPLDPHRSRRGYQWLEGDLRQAAGSRTPVREVVGSLGRAPWSVHSVWQSGDPWPAVRHLGELARRASGLNRLS